jgi:outer membrane receptor for ferrienterochelin and colicins
MGASCLAHAQAKVPELKPPEVTVPQEVPTDLPEEELSNPELPPGLKELLSNPPGLDVKEKEADAPLTIQELSNPQVKTASSRAESARDAPARVLTFSAEELKARGYRELTELLDDLPGMDTIHAWGDVYFQAYWRGYRSELGSPFLLLVDGMEFNHLWLGDTQILAALPLSSVEQVEVLYGPASARYGPNAAMGVINVITRRSANPDDGSGAEARLVAGSPQHALGRVEDMTKAVDLSAFYVGPGFRVRLTGRFDVGVLDTSLGERFEWLRDKYFLDDKLWGGFVDEAPALAGSFRSPNEKQAVDARLILENRDDARVLRGETEVAAQMYRLLTGSGLVYAADRLQARSPWVAVEQSLSLRHRQSLTGQLTSTTMLRYRRSGIDSPSSALVRDAETGNVALCYLESSSSSFGARQDFDLAAGSSLLSPGDELWLDLGIEYERRGLDKGFNVSSSEWMAGTPFENYEYPSPVSSGDRLENRDDQDNLGAYLVSRYRFWDAHTLHLGFRLDYNTTYLVEPTFRGGYVGQFLGRDLTVKLFYGQSIEEPGRTRLSDSPAGDLGEPERSGTLEGGFDYSLGGLVLQGTAYYVHFKGSLTDELEGRRRMAGVDLGATALIEIEGIRQLRVWGFYSPYLLAQETNPQDPANLIPIGDLARHKLLLGATLEVNRYLSATALGRCHSARTPMATNPVGPVPGYCVADANLRARHLFVDGLSLALRVTNLLDTKYSHPGVLTADSGNTEGGWVGNVWVGSGGDFNSLLPQPGRAFSLQLMLEL